MILFIVQNKIVSCNHLKQKFFLESKSYYPLNRRLKLLVELNLLKKIILQDGKRYLSCFSHTKEGYEVVKDLFSPCTDKMPERSEKHEHDLTMVDLKLCFQVRANVLRFYGENEYQFSDCMLPDDVLTTVRFLNADGLLRLNVNKAALDLSIEFENQRQNKSVCDKKVQRIYQSSIVASLCIVSNTAILKSLKNAETAFLESSGNSSKIFYALLKDVHLAQNELIFFNLKNQKLVIR